MKASIAAGSIALIVSAFAIGFELQASEPTTENDASGKTAHAITVYKSPNCSCCADWAEHLERNGFEVNIENTSNINEIKIQHQVPRDMASCHTGIIDGVVIEGHVPADDIKAYLESHSHPFGNKTLGLAVPGMPHGSPGMETGRQDNYDGMAFTADGKAQSVKRYEF